jgi:hypothetical protein
MTKLKTILGCSLDTYSMKKFAILEPSVTPEKYSLELVMTKIDTG